MVKIIEKICSRLKNNKIKEWEVFLQQPKSFQLYLRRNQRELIQTNKNLGFSVRIHNGGMGFATSNLIAREAIDDTIKKANKMSKSSRKTKFSFPYDQRTKKVKIVDKRLKIKNSENTLIDFSNQIIDLAKENNVTISFAKLKAFDILTKIVNSEGLYKEKNETYFFIEISLKVEREFWTTRCVRRMKDLPLEKIKVWMDLAKQLHGIEPKTERTTVIFSPSIMVDAFVPVIGYHSSASSLKKKMTFFRLNEKIADRSLTIVDDGLYPFGLMTSSFDDEGNPQRNNQIIDKGIYRGFLYDQYYGLSMKKKSTGNGLRQRKTSYPIDDKFLIGPLNQPANLMINPGKKSLDDLIKETNHGILVHKFSCLSPSAESGDFASEIRNAVYIEDGELTSGIKGGIISGNILKILNKVSGISKQIDIVSGSTSFSGIMPYVRFEDVQVAGK